MNCSNENSSQQIPGEDGLLPEELERLEQLRQSLLAELDGNGEEQEEEENYGDGDDDITTELLGEDGLTVSSSSNSSSSSSADSSKSEEDDAEEEEESGEEEEDNGSSSNSSGGWTSEEDMLERELLEAGPEQIDNMLEQSLDESQGNKPGSSGGLQKQPSSRRMKRVLEFRAIDHMNVLPDGWMEITHASGLPVFLHRPTRVCTFSRPYFIGRCSIRNHKVPESAIPCMFQRKYQAEMEAAIQQQKQGAEVAANGPDANSKGGGNSSVLLDKLCAPSVQVKTEADSQRTQLTADQLYDYAKTRFKFKHIPVFRFGKWMEARNFYKRKRRVRQVMAASAAGQQQLQMSPLTNNSQRPAISTGLRLITVPALERDSKPHQRPFYLNPQGKTSVSILHEFVQKALKCAVRYFFSETRSSATPYHCVVKLVLNNNGDGHGASTNNSPRKRGGNHHHGGKNIKMEQEKQQPAAELIKQRLAQIRELNREQKSLPLETTPVKAEADGEGADKFEGSPADAGEARASGSFSAAPAEETEFITLGEGTGAGKKHAKLLAAKDALEKMVPGIEFDGDGIAKEGGGKHNAESTSDLSMHSMANSSSGCPMLDASMASGTSAATAVDPTSAAYIFDMIGLTDTRIPELCARAGQPSPYLILQEYLKRYSAFGDTGINITSRQLRHQRHEFKLSVGEHSVKVVSGNKRDGKQMAAQAMLKRLHPKVDNWGSILRMYGYEAQQRFREARKNKDSVVKLQGIQEDEEKVGKFQPNAAILDKLRTEMLKLSEDLVRKELSNVAQNGTSSTASDPPPAKIRRADFQSDLPILSEEQFRQMSAKLEAEKPNMRRCVPNG